MIAAIVRTHRIREAMSERFHWFGWKEREDGLFVFTVIVYRGQEALIYVIIRLTTLCRPVRGGLNIDNDIRICFRLSINGFSLNLADNIFTQLEAKLEDLSLNGFIYISIYIYIHTAQIAAESSPIGKSSERKCFIVTLSAKVAQSTRRGVPLM